MVLNPNEPVQDVCTQVGHFPATTIHRHQALIHVDDSQHRGKLFTLANRGDLKQSFNEIWDDSGNILEAPPGSGSYNYMEICGEDTDLEFGRPQAPLFATLVKKRHEDESGHSDPRRVAYAIRIQASGLGLVRNTGLLGWFQHQDIYQFVIGTVSTGILIPPDSTEISIIMPGPSGPVSNYSETHGKPPLALYDTEYQPSFSYTATAQITVTWGSFGPPRILVGGLHLILTTSCEGKSASDGISNTMNITVGGSGGAPLYVNTPLTYVSWPPAQGGFPYQGEDTVIGCSSASNFVFELMLNTKEWFESNGYIMPTL